MRKRKQGSNGCTLVSPARCRAVIPLTGGLTRVQFPLGELGSISQREGKSCASFVHRVLRLSVVSVDERLRRLRKLFLHNLRRSRNTTLSQLSVCSWAGSLRSTDDMFSFRLRLRSHKRCLMAPKT
jgi:hypothetical protein